MRHQMDMLMRLACCAAPHSIPLFSSLFFSLELLRRSRLADEYSQLKSAMMGTMTSQAVSAAKWPEPHDQVLSTEPRSICRLLIYSLV